MRGVANRRKRTGTDDREPTYTAVAVARLLGITRSRVYELNRTSPASLPPSVRVGWRHLYRGVEAWLAKQAKRRRGKRAR